MPGIVKAASQAVILIATDPPEPFADVARHLTKHDRAFGAGTYLDNFRLRVHVAERLGVSPSSVDAYVVGDRGTSRVFLWSSARIGGMPVQESLPGGRSRSTTFAVRSSRRRAMQTSPSSRA